MWHAFIQLTWYSLLLWLQHGPVWKEHEQQAIQLRAHRKLLYTMAVQSRQQKQQAESTILCPHCIDPLTRVNVHTCTCWPRIKNRHEWKPGLTRVTQPGYTGLLCQYRRMVSSCQGCTTPLEACSMRWRHRGIPSTAVAYICSSTAPLTPEVAAQKGWPGWGLVSHASVSRSPHSHCQTHHRKSPGLYGLRRRSGEEEELRNWQ